MKNCQRCNEASIAKVCDYCRNDRNEWSWMNGEYWQDRVQDTPHVFIPKTVKERDKAWVQTVVFKELPDGQKWQLSKPYIPVDLFDGADREDRERGEDIEKTAIKKFRWNIKENEQNLRQKIERESKGRSTKGSYSEWHEKLQDDSNEIVNEPIRANMDGANPSDMPSWAQAGFYDEKPKKSLDWYRAKKWLADRLSELDPTEAAIWKSMAGEERLSASQAAKRFKCGIKYAENTYYKVTKSLCKFALEMEGNQLVLGKNGYIVEGNIDYGSYYSTMDIYGAPNKFYQPSNNKFHKGSMKNTPQQSFKELLNNLCNKWDATDAANRWLAGITDITVKEAMAAFPQIIEPDRDETEKVA
jgi:hypothetical protein